MPTEPIILRLTHTGLSASSIFLDDLVDGIDGRYGTPRKSGPLYIAVGQTIELSYTDDVALSFKSGSIAGFISAGHLTHEFLISSGESPLVGPDTGYVDIYVDKTGNDANDGSQTAPVLTFGRALELIPLIRSPLNPLGEEAWDHVVRVHFGPGVWEEYGPPIRTPYAVDIRGTASTIAVMPPGSVVSAPDVSPRRITFAPNPGWTPGALVGKQWMVTAGSGSFSEYSIGVIEANGADWIEVLGGWSWQWSPLDNTSEVTIQEPATQLHLGNWVALPIERLAGKIRVFNCTLGGFGYTVTSTNSPLDLYGCRVEPGPWATLFADDAVSSIGCYYPNAKVPHWQGSAPTGTSSFQGCLFDAASPTAFYMAGNMTIGNCVFNKVRLVPHRKECYVMYQSSTGSNRIDGAQNGIHCTTTRAFSMYLEGHHGHVIENCSGAAFHVSVSMAIAGGARVSGTGNQGGLKIFSGVTFKRPNANFVVTGGSGDFSIDGGAVWNAWAAVPLVNPATLAGVL